MMQAQFGDDFYGEEDGEGLSLPENIEEGVDDKTDGDVEGQEEYDENEEEFDDGSTDVNDRYLLFHLVMPYTNKG
jgi:hypothetical protein